jgi:formylglycine-generating enzyme required for sulfatase activity
MSRPLFAVLAFIGLILFPMVTGADDSADGCPEPLIAPTSDGAAQQCQENWAKYIGSEVTIENSIGMVFNIVPPGEFTMGLPESWVDSIGRDHLYDDDAPEHRVRLTQPFYVSVCETTQLQWQNVMGTNPSEFSERGRERDEIQGMNTANFPVEMVSWYDCVQFCNALSRLEGLDEYYEIIPASYEGRFDVTIRGGNGYRLLTEAEWEYACRAGTTTEFYFGTSCNGQEANIDGRFPHKSIIAGPNMDMPIPVGNYAPNAFGLYDMSGNVREWCWDCGVSFGEPAGLAIDPVFSAGDETRVCRGGYWHGVGRDAMSGSRGYGSPHHAHKSTGFRIARNP